MKKSRQNLTEEAALAKGGGSEEIRRRRDIGARIEDVQSNDTIPRLCHFHQRRRLELSTPSIQLHSDNHHRSASGGGATFHDFKASDQSHFHTNKLRKQHDFA
ncbi:Uncharacterized protein Fot_40337 [Forsythia ovata]|uniref:Uncharacterized protein n=1 Tax=Forsythia ovata TaxID=205694 RepID=A0ABD1S7C9_9LAMI